MPKFKLYTPKKMRKIAEAVRDYNDIDSTEVGVGWLNIISYNGIFVDYKTLRNSKN